VSGKPWDNPGMLAWGPQLTDEEIAAILSYVRANDKWGNNASFVKPEAVKKVRDAIASRTDPYSSDELQRVSETE
jgi:mono/diheme cytochrome c family protein